MSAIIIGRDLVLENSAACALIAASMPPMPRPVTRRQLDSTTRSLVVVTMNMPAVINNRQPKMVGRRPIRSAMPPRKTEPRHMPHNSIDRIRPSPAMVVFHSTAMPGEAKLIAITSKPSSALSATVSATITYCRRVMAAVSRVARGSLLIGSLLLLLSEDLSGQLSQLSSILQTLANHFKHVR